MGQEYEKELDDAIGFVEGEIKWSGSRYGVGWKDTKRTLEFILAVLRMARETLVESQGGTEERSGDEEPAWMPETQPRGCMPR